MDVIVDVQRTFCWQTVIERPHVTGAQAQPTGAPVGTPFETDVPDLAVWFLTTANRWRCHHHLAVFRAAAAADPITSDIDVYPQYRPPANPGHLAARRPAYLDWSSSGNWWWRDHVLIDRNRKLVWRSFENDWSLARTVGPLHPPRGLMMAGTAIAKRGRETLVGAWVAESSPTPSAESAAAVIGTHSIDPIAIHYYWFSSALRGRLNVCHFICRQTYWMCTSARAHLCNIENS